METPAIRRYLQSSRRRIDDVVTDDLRNGMVVSDAAFDAIYPPTVRARSARYWTPVDVARRAADFLVTDASTRVLDVGSGVGKFCLVGALTTRGHFTGVEQRPHLVKTAAWAAKRCNAERARFVHGDIREIDWRQFDAFYFYNPFAENCAQPDERLDHTVVLDRDRFYADVSYSLAALAGAPFGTRVATYHGLGVELPGSYARTGFELAGSDLLELFTRVRAPSAGDERPGTSPW